MFLLSLAGCKVGPDYKRPATPVSPAFTGVTNGWKIAQPQAHLGKDRWWEVFNDPELNRLEVEAAAANQEIKIAAARFEEARATIDISRSGLFPHINGGAAAIRARDSFNRPVNGKAANYTETYNTFTVPFDASYELDLWGRIRREVESSRDLTAASAADLQSVRLSIEAEVAADYFAARALDSEIQLLNASVQAFAKSLELVRHRKEGGIATDLDVSQAETVLKATEAQIPTAVLHRLHAQNALAVLLGRPAPGFSLPEQPLTLPPIQLAPGVPSELLERRPDVAAAEYRMASANARIGVAKAAFYPAVRLTGLAGLTSVDAGTLFNWPSRFWAIGPSLTVPIFEGGKLRADLRRAAAGYDETVAAYRQTVLKAFAEVEDNLAGQELLGRAADAQDVAFKAARRSWEIASNRYRLGSASYLDVAAAQAESLTREREAISLRGQQLFAVVALAKSIGGGWQNPGATALDQQPSQTQKPDNK